MTAAELRAFLDGVPDDAEVVYPGGDHEYFVADVYAVKAERTRHGDYYEHADAYARARDSVVVDVVVIGIR